MQKKFPIQERIKRTQQEETGCPVAGLREEFCFKRKTKNIHRKKKVGKRKRS